LTSTSPNLLYSDGGVPFNEVGLHIIAHLYNTSAKLHDDLNQSVYTQKTSTPDVFTVGILDIERGIQQDIFPYPWQTDTCVGGWFYNVRTVYKTPQQVIEMLVDIVSKNGNLLLNFPQKPDGTLDEECLYILKCMAVWIKVNGEGIYSTRPWEVAGEGPATSEGGVMREKDMEWSNQDFRFTTKDNKVYAFQMKWPEDGRVLIKTFALEKAPKVADVRLLGFNGQIMFKQDHNGLHIKLPAQKVCDYVHCFCLELG